MSVVDFKPADRPGADEKARLIAEALGTLRAAQQIDERDSLDVEGWVAWYDATIPQVRDLKVLAGAMEIELHRRRGEEPKRAPGPRPNEFVTQRVTNSDPASRMQRMRDRALAAAPERVAKYIERQVSAGGVPSVRGAMRAVTANRSAEERAATRFEVGRARAARRTEEWIRTLDTVADGQRRTDPQLAALGIVVDLFLQNVAFLPWLAIDRTHAGTTFIIDQELRAICEGRIPRPALGHQSIRAYLEHLRSEIARRRKENHDEFRKRKWNHELILKREQTALLDWIEEQLLKVPT